MQTNPWSNVEDRYQPGQQITGKVTRLTHFGLFVEVEPGLEGIVYTFELGQRPSALASFAPDQQLQLYVKSIDVARKRLELSPHQEQGLLTTHNLPLETPLPLTNNKPDLLQLSKLKPEKWPPELPSAIR